VEWKYLFLGREILHNAYKNTRIPPPILSQFRERNGCGGGSGDSGSNFPLLIKG
jgi:hypothetical protein